MALNLIVASVELMENLGSSVHSIICHGVDRPLKYVIKTAEVLALLECPRFIESFSTMKRRFGN